MYIYINRERERGRDKYTATHDLPPATEEVVRNREAELWLFAVGHATHTHAPASKACACLSARHFCILVLGHTRAPGGKDAGTLCRQQ